MSKFWKKIERIGFEDFPYYLDDGDICFYARDYIAEGGYSASTANQLIQNFKKSPDRKGRPEWKYKRAAIKQFAEEIAIIQNIESYLLTCIPCSTVKQDPMYDSRLEDTLTHLKRMKPNLEVEFPLSFRDSMVKSHHGGSRNPDEIYNNLEWSNIRSSKTTIILIDDVLTTGAHFKACKMKITENIEGAIVIGLFWAKTVWSKIP